MEGRCRHRPLLGADRDLGSASPGRVVGSRRWGGIAVVLVVGVIALCFWRPWETSEAPRQPPNETLTARIPSTDNPASSDQRTSNPEIPLPKTVPELMEEAERVANGVEQRFPDDPFALDCVAKAQLYLGKTTTAAEHWRRCLQLDSQAAFAYEGLGRIAGMKGEYEEAASLFRKALALAPKSSGAAWLSETACQLAEMLTKLSKIEEATAVLEESIRVNPESATSHRLLGQLLLQSKEYEKARECFEQSIRIEPSSSLAHFGLANALRRMGNREESSQYMEKFKKLRAKESNARTGTRSVDQEPKVMARTVAMTLTHAGQIYHKHRDMQEAQRHWRRAAMLNQGNTACRSFLAALYVETNQTAKALETYKQLIAIEPANPMFHWQLGTLHARLGQFDAAEGVFASILELAPEGPQGYAAMASLYLQFDRNLEEAKKLAQEAVRIDPVGPHYALLSRVCERTGDQAGAMAAGRKVIEWNRENAVQQQKGQRIERNR